jgi:hypothetical protein
MESMHRSNPILAKPYHIADYNKSKAFAEARNIGNLNPNTVIFSVAPDSYGNQKITYTGKNSNCRNCSPDAILLSYLNLINNQTIDEITRAYGNTFIPFSVYSFYLTKNTSGFTFNTSGRRNLSPVDKAEYQVILEKKLPNQHAVLLNIITRNFVNAPLYTKRILFVKLSDTYYFYLDPENGLIAKEITGKDEFTAWMAYATSIETLDHSKL